jgi:hypothetical protein
MGRKPGTKHLLPSSGEDTLDSGFQPGIRVPREVVGEDIFGVRGNILREM